MPRIKVAIPDQFLFSMERVVGFSDVNYAKHLDSVSMVSILHEARLQFLASLGFAESNIFGLGMVVTDLAVDYRSESFPKPAQPLPWGQQPESRRRTQPTSL